MCVAVKDSSDGGIKSLDNLVKVLGLVMECIRGLSCLSQLKDRQREKNIYSKRHVAHKPDSLPSSLSGLELRCKPCKLARWICLEGVLI